MATLKNSFTYKQLESQKKGERIGQTNTWRYNGEKFPNLSESIKSPTQETQWLSSGINKKSQKNTLYSNHC